MNESWKSTLPLLSVLSAVIVYLLYGQRLEPEGLWEWPLSPPPPSTNQKLWGVIDSQTMIRTDRESHNAHYYWVISSNQGGQYYLRVSQNHCSMGALCEMSNMVLLMKHGFCNTLYIQGGQYYLRVSKNYCNLNTLYRELRKYFLLPFFAQGFHGLSW